MAKKSFIDNPALQFLSTQPETQISSETHKPEEAPDGYKVNPVFIEVKSRRLQLVLQPSLFEKVKAKAAEEGISVNEFCHRALEDATKGE